MTSTSRRLVVAFAAAAFGVAICATAHAEDVPKLKPGLWEMVRKSARTGDAGQRTVVCMDEAVQRQMWDMGMGAMRGMCSKSDMHIAGGRGTGDFVCNMGGSTMRTKAQITFTGDTGYRADIDTTYEPPQNGEARSRSVIEARHLGACKAGQQPGDLVLPNGRTINIRNAFGGTRK